jgi:hypothetical protein
MSVGPVSLDWFIAQTRLQPHVAEQLLEQLRHEGCVQRIDLSRIGREESRTDRPLPHSQP